MKRIRVLILSILIVLAVTGFVLSTNADKVSQPSAEQAVSRIELFVEGINYNKPEIIYEHLLKDYQQAMTRKEFIKHWDKERSYPYLTPLFIYIDEITFSEDFLQGQVKAIVAARLPGEYMYFSFKWQDDNYYMDTFTEILDGSYLQKFDRLAME